MHRTKRCLAVRVTKMVNEGQDAKEYCFVVVVLVISYHWRDDKPAQDSLRACRQDGGRVWPTIRGASENERFDLFAE